VALLRPLSLSPANANLSKSDVNWPALESWPTLYAAWFWWLFIVCFFATAAVESIRPRTVLRMSANGRWASNLGLWATSTVLITTVAGLGPVGMALWAEHAHFGLLHQFPLSPLSAVLITFFILDFAAYWEHRLSHSFGLLWRLHEVHHSDPDFDLTTGFRFHPVEALVRISAGMLVTAACGLSAGGVVLNALLVLVFTLADHANVAVPANLDRAIRTVFVSPGLHRNHHSREMGLQQTNYGVILSIWDRMFGTWSDPHNIETYGIDGLRNEDTVNFFYMLREPFRKTETPES